MRLSWNEVRARAAAFAREWADAGYEPVVPSNLVRVLEGATKSTFALLTSAMHMAWLRHVGGRLESRYRYSVGLVYNTFPTPPGWTDDSAARAALDPLAQTVLDARAAHPDSTLADLYDPDLMPDGRSAAAAPRPRPGACGPARVRPDAAAASFLLPGCW